MADKKQSSKTASSKKTSKQNSQPKGKMMDGLEPGAERFVATGASIVPTGRWMPEDGPEALAKILAKPKK